MSTSKFDTSGIFQPLTLQTSSTKLALPADRVRFRKNGVEFLSTKPLPLWSEMTVNLQSPQDGRKVAATGVVVECLGNRHSGYSVALLFTNLSRQSQARLSELAVSQPA
jgi:hypothetical protein